MSLNTAPITRENQYFVICGGLVGCDAPWEVMTVYAKSPEEAVAAVKRCFTFDDLGRPCEADDGIRIAVAWELPWNQPNEASMVRVKERTGEYEFITYFDQPEDAKKLYGDDLISVRRPTVDELEKSIRENRVIEDQEHEEQFNYGFNVLYKEQLENGDFDR